VYFPNRIRTFASFVPSLRGGTLMGMNLRVAMAVTFLAIAAGVGCGTSYGRGEAGQW
jgi:hypothetical protein